MSTPASTYISGVAALLQLFFANNPTVEEIVTILEQIGPALAAEQAGQAFSLAFPLTLATKAGTVSFAWSPLVA